MGMGAREEGRRGLAEMLSINHDPCYHELHYVSNDIIVLVFSELNSLVRKILQEEENKGVELTGGCGNGDEPRMGMRGGKAENLEKSGRRMKVGEESNTARLKNRSMRHPHLAQRLRACRPSVKCGSEGERAWRF
jgi:hypothetical protein